MTRIFLTSSHFSTLLMAVYARDTREEGTKDILLIDRAKRKPAVIKHFRDAAAAYAWTAVHDLSIPISHTDDYAPGFVKKMTRRFKSKPLIRNIYNFLLEHHQKKTIKEQQELLRKHIGIQDEHVTLFAIKETVLFDALQALFPKAEMNHFEHGLSDYTLLMTDPPSHGNFYCVFADPFRKFLSGKNISFSFVQPFLHPGTFSDVCKAYFNAEKEAAAELKKICSPGKKYALVIMQPVEIYQIDSHSFWSVFFDKCRAQIDDPSTVTFIIKLHPYQAKSAAGIAENYFRKYGLQHTILPETMASSGIEISFSLWQEHINYVFSPYSSALFYISRLFPNAGRTCYYDFELISNFNQRSPAHFVKLWNDSRPLISGVFAEKCREL